MPALAPLPRTLCGHGGDQAEGLCVGPVHPAEAGRAGERRGCESQGAPPAPNSPPSQPAASHRTNLTPPPPSTPLPLHNAHPPNPQAIIANNTLLTRPPPPVPTLIFNIKVDELVDPQAQAVALARAWCAAGGTVELQMLPAAEHGVGALANLVPQLLWLGDAFAGRGLAPPGTCVGVE